MSKIEASVPPSVLIVTGRSAPGECGVADYSDRLMSALSDKALEVEHLELGRLRELPAGLRRMGQQTVVHLQYPMLAWRKSLLPLFFLLCLRLRGHRLVILTLHEFSRAHWARRALCVLLARLSQKVLSTSRFEAAELQRRLNPAMCIVVVPIAANIEPEQAQGAAGQRAGVVYFGLLAPEKGLEQFLGIVVHGLPHPLAVTVVGSVVPGHEAWLRGLQARHPNVRFLHALTNQEVSAVLNGALVAVLPYPDGISERRTTALAALAHGLQVVSTRGSSTTAELAEVCHLVSTMEEARECTGRLLRGAVNQIDPAVIDRYVRSRSWDGIAARHIDLYHATIVRTKG